MSFFRRVVSLGLAGLGSILAAQAPAPWNAQPLLGQGQTAGTPWYGFGFWAADQHGPTATLVDTLGMGNAITGLGFHLEGGIRTGHWDLAAKGLGVRAPSGAASLTLYQGHVTWRSREVNGWNLGLEQEPLVWGYGLNGGYLLGEAARPFPRFALTTPMTHLHLGRVGLGTWGFQAFMGRLESQRELSPILQDPLAKRGRLTRNGDPQGPFLNGYRLQARFGENLEFYANYINLWGGSINGQSMTQGYGFKDYVTAMFGLKDVLAEANIDPRDPNRPETPYRNKALSASNADLGLRWRARALEPLLGADSVYFHLSRGSKNVWWNPGLLLKRPLYYLGQDLDTALRNLGQARFTRLWNETGRYSIPNLSSPNDTIGVLIAWPRLRLGLEYLDTVNSNAPDQGVRAFGHPVFLSGFYSHGDPLGNALGGEATITTVKLEADLGPRLACSTLVHFGGRPFRDSSPLWQAAHPGLVPATDRYLGVQQGLKARLAHGATLSLAAAWERHSAIDNLPGRSGNGFRYSADLGWRWPRP